MIISGHWFVFCPDCFIRDASGVQVPRHVGFLHRAHLLDATSQLPHSGGLPEGSLWWGITSCLCQQGEQPCLSPSQPPTSGAWEPSSQAAIRHGPGLFREITKLLLLQWQDWHHGNFRKDVQQLLSRPGRMRAVVLRTWVQDSDWERDRALPLHLPLVLSCQLLELYKHTNFASVPMISAVYSSE